MSFGFECCCCPCPNCIKDDTSEYSVTISGVVRGDGTGLQPACDHCDTFNRTYVLKGFDLTGITYGCKLGYYNKQCQAFSEFDTNGGNWPCDNFPVLPYGIVMGWLYLCGESLNPADPEKYFIQFSFNEIVALGPGPIPSSIMYRKYFKDPVDCLAGPWELTPGTVDFIFGCNANGENTSWVPGLDILGPSVKKFCNFNDSIVTVEKVA